MKKSIIHLRTLFIVTWYFTSITFVKSQSFAILPANTQTITFNCDSSAQQTHVYISNPNAYPLDLSYTTILNTLPKKECWGYQFCDWSQCFSEPPTTIKHPGVAVPSNSNNKSFNFDITTFSTKGAGVLSIKLYETNNPTNFQIITWNITGCASGNECTIGISESSFENSIAIYPNPAINTITIDTKNIENINTLDVFNLIGENMIHQDVNEQDKCTLNISKLEKGIYIIEIHSTNNIFVTKKLIKN